MGLNQEIERRISDFAAELAVLVRREALASVATALGTTNGAPVARRGPGRPRKTAAPARAATPSSPVPVAKRRKGAKRDPKEIVRLTAAVAAHVKQHPGEGVEKIAGHLRVKTSELNLPIAKLLAGKTITRKGIKRATKYFPK